MSGFNELQVSPTSQTVLVFLGILYVHLWGLWSSQLAHHFANEINQGPYYVKHFHGKIRTRIIPQLYIGHLLLELSPNRLQYLV